MGSHFLHSCSNWCLVSARGLYFEGLGKSDNPPARAEWVARFLLERPPIIPHPPFLHAPHLHASLLAACPSFQNPRGNLLPVCPSLQSPRGRASRAPGAICSLVARASGAFCSLLARDSRSQGALCFLLAEVELWVGTARSDFV